MTEETFYAGSGDGHVVYRHGNYTTCHDALSGNGKYSTDWYIIPYHYWDSPYYYISRGFLPFDTSALSDGIVVSNAKLKINVNSLSIGACPSGEKLCIVQASQADPTTLAYGDYDEVGDTIGGEIELSSLTTGWNEIALNATGISWINKTGWTKLGLRIKGDVTSTPPTSLPCKLEIKSKNYPFGDPESQLIVTYLSEEATLGITHSLEGGYNVKQEDTWIIDRTLEIDTIISHSLGQGILKSYDIVPLFSGIPMRTLETTMDIALQTYSLLEYGLSEQKNILFDLLPNIEVTRVIGTSGVGNLLNYRVTQEWQAPYDIAELRFKSIPIFEVGDYVHIFQKDYFTNRDITIFRGVTISADKTYKKSFEETSLKAVSNEWYLTKQFTFWEEYLEHLSLFPTINAKRYIKYWLGRGSFEAETEGREWQNISGVRPFIIEEIPDWITEYCREGECNFNFLFGKTTKMDAINQLCDACDFTFWCSYSGSFAKRHAHFYPRSMIDSGYYPFGEQVTIDATDEAWGFNKRLLELHSREQQTTFDTKINRVAMTCKDFPIVFKEKAFTGEVGGPKPVEIHKGINWAKVQTIEQLQDACDSLYEYLRKSNMVYEAKLLSLVEKPDFTTLHTGMKIKFQNVDGHPEDIYRIMKITHEKSGDKPIAETTIEYRDTDLIHLGSPKLNEIGMILNHVEDKVAEGARIPGYPSATNPRAVSIGDTTGISVGEVTAYNESENKVDIKLDKTNQVIRGVPVV